MNSDPFMAGSEDSDAALEEIDAFLNFPFEKNPPKKTNIANNNAANFSNSLTNNQRTMNSIDRNQANKTLMNENIDNSYIQNKSLDQTKSHDQNDFELSDADIDEFNLPSENEPSNPPKEMPSVQKNLSIGKEFINKQTDNKITEPLKMETKTNPVKEVPKNDFHVSDSGHENEDDDPFAMSDISIPDLGDGFESKKDNNKIINDKNQNLNLNKNISEDIFETFSQPIEDKKKANTIKVSKKGSETVGDSKLPKIENNKAKEKQSSQVKKETKNQDNEVQTPKLNQKKIRRRQPVQRKPLTIDILGDLGFTPVKNEEKENNLFTIEEELADSIVDDFVNNTTNATTNVCDNTLNNINNVNNEIVLETPKKSLVTNPVDEFEAITSPPHITAIRNNIVTVPQEIMINPIDNFERSLLSYLKTSLADVHLTFLKELKDNMEKSFDFDNLVNKFTNQLEKEINEIINEEAEQKLENYIEIEGQIVDEFKQILTLPSKQFNTNENEEIILLDPTPAYDQLQSLKSKITNAYQKLLKPTDSYTPLDHLDNISMNNNDCSLTNPKLLQIYDLEAEEIRITMENDYIKQRLMYIKQQHFNAQETNMISMNSYSSESNGSVSDDVYDVLEDLKSYSEKKSNISHLKTNNEIKTAIEEINIIDTQVTAKTMSLLQLLSLCNSSCQGNNPPSIASTTTNNLNYSLPSDYFSFSIDGAPGYSRCGVVEDVRSRLSKIKKFREDTIADLHHFAPRLQYA
ncbi:hypothetical protein TRFO_05959 [Tritrichomonas foetus]|uniref:Uncharacterized protein n=1 Tax=Tritrichomonas foetus TaxID=1144522 RepID=A0A1J4K6N4_9EUKA|nr:hypothetical protein TRFO_05959 [Tritrichomonas foetus]|eukprot:OHT05374.1 hypothetical protein TRFO_05959 [Tritrichomonas foetus]